ncbi:FG-GAP repeat domain-containing protein [Streptomyces sp. NPDC051561]|uniref:FG-GAP repeat domain-containing protein n=1 Tax=Streptomyces sp. NPDC051561 TaxID=3365658 RepID=UPI0037A9FC4F
MADHSSRTAKRGRALSRTAVAALAAALIGTTAGAAHAGDTPAPHAKIPQTKLQAPPQARLAAPRAAAAPGAAGVIQRLVAVSGNNLYLYTPTFKGGYNPREFANDTWGDMKAASQTDHDGDGVATGLWGWDKAGHLYSWPDGETEAIHVGGGWNMYNRVFSPGNLAGSQGYDLVARDAQGVLWLYLGYTDGRVTSRIKIGAGWGQYTQIAGVGDLTGDNTADMVARDRNGVLWLYQGTGSYKAPFKARTQIGKGWNNFNLLVGAGDLDSDGQVDLVGRGNDGSLWRASGTGKAVAPYKPAVKIASGGMNGYRLMF